jgi:uncharacterized protein (TIGR02996 family)
MYKRLKPQFVNEEHFIQGLKENPLDAYRWLVYADFLDEHGYHRAPFIRRWAEPCVRVAEQIQTGKCGGFQLEGYVVVYQAVNHIHRDLQIRTKNGTYLPGHAQHLPLSGKYADGNPAPPHKPYTILVKLACLCRDVESWERKKEKERKSHERRTKV